MALLVYLACCVTWGSTWCVIAVGLRDLPPLLFAGLRMVLAGALLMPFALREASKLGLRSLAWLAGVGLLQIALPYAFMFVAQQWTPSSLAAVLFATFPVWLVLLGWLVLGERLTFARGLAALLGVGGVLVLEAPRLRTLTLHGPLALASLLVVAGSLSAAVANIALKRHGGRWSPATLTTVQTLVSGVALLLASALLERGRPAHFTPSSLAALGYLAVFATAGTYLGLYWLLRRVPLAVIATIPLLDTTVAFALGALVLHEPLGASMFLGGALVVAGALVAHRAAPG